MFSVRSFEPILAKQRGLLTVLLVSLLLWMLSGIPVEMPVWRSDALLMGLQLFWGGACLFLAGWFACAAFFSAESPLRRLPPLVYLVAGQILLCAYVYGRSFSSQLFFKFAHLKLPLTTTEFYMLLVALAAFTWFKKVWRFKSLLSTGRTAPEAAGFVLLLLGLTLLVALLELPRHIMLSSDPDQHAFWTMQILRFGSVPREQGAWGPDPFQYPAGFAVLSYVWCVFSSLDPRQIITAQVPLQSQLAVLLAFQSAASFLAPGRRELALSFLGNLFVLLLYYTLLPYGYQQLHYHMEGTARISSLLIGSALITITLWQWSLTRQGKILKLREFALLCATLGLITGLSALINPANALYPACLSLFVFAAPYFSRPRPKARYFLAGCLAALCSVAMPLSDPYYLDTLRGTTHAAIQRNTGTPFDSRSVASTMEQRLLNTLSAPVTNLRTGLVEYLKCNVVEPGIFRAVFFLLCGLYIFLRPALKAGLYWPLHLELLFFALPLAALLLQIFVFAPAFSAFANHPVFHLLAPYARHSAEQLLYLWLFFLTGILLTVLLDRRSILNAALGTALLAVAMLEGSTLSKITQVGYRYRYPGAFGAVTDEDLRVIADVEKNYAEFLAANPGAGPDQTPRILVPNMLSSGGAERWLFPSGASRALPFYDTFPIAFFYNQANRAYTYRSYRKHVCNNFNLQWLKSQRIQYLFVPADRGPVCVHGLQDLLEKGNAVSRHGEAAFIKLY